MPMNSCDLGGANKYCFTESNTAWRLITVKHPSIIAPLIGATPAAIYVVPCRPPNGLAVSLSEVMPSFQGFVYLPTPGDYYVNLPVVGSAAAERCFVVIDAGSPEGAVALLKIMKAQQALLVNTAGLIADLANADGNPDFGKTLVGLLVNARNAMWLDGSSEWGRMTGDSITTINGEGPGTREYLRTAAGIFGRDTSDTTLRAIEARAFASNAGVSAALYGALVNARNGVLDVLSDSWDFMGGMGELGSSVRPAIAGGYNVRDSGYWACRRGRRFRATTEGAVVTASNGFGATAPRFTLEAGATNELIVRKIKISCLVAGTTNLQYRIILDPDARYSSGGTAGTVGARVNMNGGSATAAGFTFHYGAITATATDADEREVETGTIVNVTGNGVEITFEDGLIVPASGTLLIYLIDAGATGTAYVNVELEEANIQ